MGKIIWLSSYPKSGNTWIRIILSNLLSGSEKPVSINNLPINTIASSREIFDEFSGLESSDLTNEEIINFRPSVYKELSDSIPEDFLFVKVHDAWQLTPLGEPMFPKEATKCVLYIIRHPLDVAASNANHYSIDFQKSLINLMNPNYTLAKEGDHIEHQLKQFISSWVDHVESWTVLSKLPVHVIRYEDLIIDGYLVIKDALDFADLKFTDHQIKTALRNSKFDLLKAQEKSIGFSEKPINASQFFNTGKSDNWRKIYDVTDFESLAGDKIDVIRKYGYP